MTKIRKYTAVVFLGLIFLAGLSWLIVRETAPKPGISITVLSRDHVADSTPVTYNSNPPTSGPHSEDWERAGIYDTPLNDRKLVHSLEHGYVIISYNCDYKNQTSCQQLVTQLKELANKKKLWKLIVVPRPNLDNRIALTAWTRLDKFYDFDEKRIVVFIDAFRDRGPEQTME